MKKKTPGHTPECVKTHPYEYNIILHFHSLRPADDILTCVYMFARAVLVALVYASYVYTILYSLQKYRYYWINKKKKNTTFDLPTTNKSCRVGFEGLVFLRTLVNEAFFFYFLILNTNVIRFEISQEIYQFRHVSL